jgi:hypothetical protein
MNNVYPDVIGTLVTLTGLSAAVITSFFLVSAAWTIVLKGFGLWYAARNQQKYWFIAMLIINDLGILEIIYLLWFRKDKKSMMPQTQPVASIAIAPSEVV